MLTDFRSVFPGVPLRAAETARGCNKADPGLPVTDKGCRVEEGVRSPVLDVVVNDLAGVDGGWRPDAFRLLATGSAGRAIVGGPLDGLEGFWSVVVILCTWKGYQMVAFWFKNDKSSFVDSSRWPRKFARIQKEDLFVNVRTRLIREGGSSSMKPGISEGAIPAVAIDLVGN